MYGNYVICIEQLLFFVIAHINYGIKLYIYSMYVHPREDIKLLIKSRFSMKCVIEYCSMIRALCNSAKSIQNERLFEAINVIKRTPEMTETHVSIAFALFFCKLIEHTNNIQILSFE